MTCTVRCLVDADSLVSGRALDSLVGPELRRRITTTARTVRGFCACPGVGEVCARCQTCYDEILTKVWLRLRAASCGQLPSSGGNEIREWRLILNGMDDPAIADIDADMAGQMLRNVAHGNSQPAAAEPVMRWLRAVWFQMVVFETKPALLKSTMTRMFAVERGLPAKPNDSIGRSPAARVLAADPAADAALREAVVGIHANVSDPLHLPSTQLAFELSAEQARQAFDRALAVLRGHDPELLARLVLIPLGDMRHAQLPDRPNGRRTADAADGCSWQLYRGHEVASLDDDGPGQPDDGRDRARGTLLRSLAAAVESHPPRDRRAGRAPALVRMLRLLVLAADGGPPAGLVERCQRLFRLDEQAAAVEVQRLALLVAEAGVAWVDAVLARAEQTQAA
ncbi:hypothetical protein [Frankia tisae]|uniref:hypothetical protein n=1 Tax=Frankia tisae TaxID=2950104 RepID=UPI0021BE4896|nr:hypothetical protein [Frankia tisae]